MAVLTSSHWGAYRASSSVDGSLQVEPFENDLNPSEILKGVAAAFDHPTRVRTPVVRRGWLESRGRRADGRRGCDEFVELPWDEVLDLVTSEIRRVRENYGNDAILGGSYGWSSAGRFHHAKSQLKRFLSLGGGYVDQENNYSFGAAMVLLPYLVGGNFLLYGPSTNWLSLQRNCELLVAFGGISEKNAQVEAGGCGDHTLTSEVYKLTSSGCEIISISPIKSDIVEGPSAKWQPIVPGSDTALMLAICYCLLENEIYDAAFLQTYCVGFEVVSEYLRRGRNGKGYTPEWASELTGISADCIVELSKAMALKRTFISVSWSLQRADFGEQTYWAAITLAAMLGQIGLPGGGIGFGYGCVNGTGNSRSGVRSPALPEVVNPVATSIPVARVADLLANPGKTLRYNGRDIVYPDIRLVYWAGGNPFHHHQDLTSLAAAWQRPETVIVHESWWTATARRADIILPATTTLERNDIGASSGDRFLIAMKQVMPPFEQAKDDHQIFRELAGRLGYEEEFSRGLDEFEWLRGMYARVQESAGSVAIQTPEFEEFWDGEYLEFETAETEFDSFKEFRKDPRAAPLRTPSGKIELYSETIASFGYSDCPGHACWIEPREWRRAPVAEKYPLHLISNQPKTRLHGQLDLVGISEESKISGREPVRINPIDAKARRLSDRDIVRVFNARGACLAGVVISDAVLEGVVQLSTGAWYDPLNPAIPDSFDLSGNPNVLTHDLGSSTLSWGPAAQSTMVEIERFTQNPPGRSVYRPPTIVAGGV